MERSPVIGWVFHIRILSLLMLLAHADFYFIHHAYHVTTSKGPSVQLVFGFEYSILIIMIANILIKVINVLLLRDIYTVISATLEDLYFRVKQKVPSHLKRICICN